MTRAYVIGASVTRFGNWPGQTLSSLAGEAVGTALADAGLEAGQIGGIYFANAAAGLITGQEMIRGHVALRRTPLAGKPVIDVESACASGSFALHIAAMAVRSGEVDVALALGVERMSHTDRQVTFRALETGVDLDELRELKARGGNDGGRSVFMDIYAEKTRRFLSTFDADERDLAAISVKNRRAASLNPNAQFTKEISVEDVLASRVVSAPLTLLMCAPVSDGAAALVVASERIVRSLGRRRAVEIRASCIASGSGDTSLPSGARRAADSAYAKAAAGPRDIDIAEVHDATAPAELMMYETLGFCAAGEEASLVRSGATGIGGRLPVNPSGGLLSRGHPVGATGCAQIVELVAQLRGEAGPRQRPAARLALAENHGGTMGPDAAAAAVTILSV